MLRVGDKAPDFSGVADDGTMFRLNDRLAQGPAVLAFYIKDFTKG